MQEAQQARSVDDSRHIDTETFVEWCEAQIEKSRCTTSRIIVNNDDQIKFRLRESERGPEDIVLLKGKSADTVRFVTTEDTRQFHAHKRDFTFHDKTMIVRHSSGAEMARAGTGTRNKRGPFPI